MTGRSWLGSLCLTAAASIWGGMYVVSKSVLVYIPPFVLLWLRYLIALLILAVILLKWKRERIERSDLPLFVWLGFIGYFVSNGSGFIGTNLSTAHMGTLITASAPAFTVIFAYWLLGEKLSVKKVFSAAVATIGVLIVIGFDTIESTKVLLGNIFLLIDALSWALYSVYVKRASHKYSALVISAYATTVALIFTTPLMAWQLEFSILPHLQKPSVWGGTLYLGVVATAAAFYLWNKGMEYMEAGIGSMFYFFTPLVGAFFGWLMLNEQLHWNFFLGGILIIIGAAAASQTEQPITNPIEKS